MKKRKINPSYLRAITSHEVKDETIDTLDFTLSIKEFAEDYLRGIMTVKIEGEPKGKVALKLPVVSYLIRLLCENVEDDEMLEINISIGDTLVMQADYETLGSTEDVVHLVKVAKYAGFEVERSKNTFKFIGKIKLSPIMQIYAVSSSYFKDMLVTTYNM